MRVVDVSFLKISIIPIAPLKPLIGNTKSMRADISAKCINDTLLSKRVETFEKSPFENLPETFGEKTVPV